MLQYEFNGHLFSFCSKINFQPYLSSSLQVHNYLPDIITPRSMSTRTDHRRSIKHIKAHHNIWSVHNSTKTLNSEQKKHSRHNFIHIFSLNLKNFKIKVKHPRSFKLTTQSSKCRITKKTPKLSKSITHCTSFYTTYLVEESSITG